jgi:eukaryotic-like serine/threonine-protein kinase
MTNSGFRGRTGQVLANRYELLRVIGSGGQSIIYHAHDRVDGDDVALKILEWSDPDSCERMFREALVMSQLADTAAVRVLHQVRTNDGAMALVMELLEGRNLAVELADREAHGVRADAGWLVSICEPVVRTLDAAHDRGIVHRDIKAENVFVLAPERGGGVRVLDFGFAKLLRAPTITGQEHIGGSPAYLAPEVWTEGSWRAEPGADIYAFGILVFRILGGRLPFSGTAIEIMRGAVEAPRPSLHELRPDLHPDLDGWIAQVLAVRPADRFQRVRAAWRALVDCL